MMAGVNSIGDLVKLGVAQIQTGPFGSQLHSYEYVTSGIHVVPTEAIRERRIDHDVCPQITPDKASELARHRLLAGDILFARRGVQATGHIGVVRSPEEGFVCGTGAIRLRVSKSNNAVCAEYLSHLLADPASIAWFKFHAIGATMPNLNEGIIRNFPLQLPEYHYQRAVAAFLSALDDKIELNRRMHETLEAMAQAIFRDWFVDFGPVRRKLEGTSDPVEIMGGLMPDPTRAAELAGLFPDGFGEDELPVGWSLMPLSDVAAQCKGAVNPQAFPDTLFEHYSLPAHDTGQEPARDLGIDIKSNKVPVPAGAILVSKLNPETLRVWAPTEYAGFPQVASTEFLVFTPKPLAGRGLLYFLFRDPIVRQIMVGMVTGTSKSHQRISPPALLQTKLVVGERMTFAAFEELAEPILLRCLALRAENRTLAETRDYLLPRLMSGEVRVGDAVQEIAA